MISTRRPGALGAAMLLFAWTGTASRAQDGSPPFPPASPESAGLAAENLELLAAHVRDLVRRDEVVGAELHVIKDRRTVLHRAFGHADRDQERPMELDSIFCVRSMTKPFTGTAVEMLVDEGLLRLDTEVSELLPAFDAPRLDDVTIEHLLGHTSGLPFSAIARPLGDYASLRDVANEAATHGLSFGAGAGFQYSDAGSDTLGATIEEVTGTTAAAFIRNRILDPLEMDAAITLLEPGDERVRSIPSAYSGGPGAWKRHWSPDDAPIFPLFLTSQSLYATTTDYARFLALWLDRGVVGDRRLLTEAAVLRAHAPGELVEEYRSGFPGVEVTYGHQWLLYHSEAKSGFEPLVFGHAGSDGTQAWAWPEQDLMVLFFTQSRGSTAGQQLERTLHTLLIEQDGETYRARRRAESEAAKELARYAGLYWDEDVAGAYYVVTPREGHLVLERPGKFRSEFKMTDEPGRFGDDSDGGLSFRFDGPPDGPATAMVMTFSSGKVERQERHRIDDTLPNATDVAAGVRRAHGMDRLSEVGAVRRQGLVSGVTSGSIDMTFDATRTRAEISGPSRAVIRIDGDRAFTSAQGAPPKEESGATREQMVLDHPCIAYGGWAGQFREIEVLKRIDDDGPKLLVRTVGAETPGSTKIIDEESGLLIGEDRIEFIPGLGYVGVRVEYADHRDVSGLRLPFRISSTYASTLLGVVRIEFDRFEVGAAAMAQLDPEGR